jgi:hypothetical protein
MGHLGSDELVDLADGTRPESSAPHLTACDACRRSLADLRAAMQAAAGVDVPEPSPLFWDHFSARVRDAVAADAARPAGWWGRWSWTRLALPVSLAGVAALALAFMLTSRVGPLPTLKTPRPLPAPALAEAAALADDPAIDLVADLAQDLDWEAAHEAGFVAHRGELDSAIRQMTDAERLELQRLLKEELRRSGN